MPHDIKGSELKIGDTVTMSFKVTGMTESQDQCNVSLQALDFTGSVPYRPAVACNSKLTRKVE